MQYLMKALHGAEVARPYGVNANIEDRGDLGVFELLQVSQFNNLAILRLEGGQRLSHSVALFQFDHLLARSSCVAGELICQFKHRLFTERRRRPLLAGDGSLLSAYMTFVKFEQLFPGNAA